MNAHPALVFNANFQPLSYFPLSLLPWDRAIKAVVEETHYVVEQYDAVVRSPSITIRLPSVLALKKFHPAPKHVAFTRFNVFLRDRFRCQYCGEKHASHDLTFDHVKPKCMGGPTSWDNVVAACSPCNVRKDSSTADEAAARAEGADATRTPCRQTRVPAELPARDLARLSVLGRRARAINSSPGSDGRALVSEARGRRFEPAGEGQHGAVIGGGPGAVLKTVRAARRGDRTLHRSANTEGQPAGRPASLGKRLGGLRCGSRPRPSSMEKSTGQARRHGSKADGTARCVDQDHGSPPILCRPRMYRRHASEF